MADDPEVTLWEACAQPYDNCKFSAGLIDGHQIEVIYLRLEGDGRETREFLLRADEAAAIAWVLNGALLSYHQEKK